MSVNPCWTDIRALKTAPPALSAADDARQDADQLGQLADVILLLVEAHLGAAQAHESPQGAGGHRAEDLRRRPALPFVEQPGPHHRRQALAKARLEVLGLG